MSTRGTPEATSLRTVVLGQTGADSKAVVVQSLRPEAVSVGLREFDQPDISFEAMPYGLRLTALRAINDLFRGPAGLLERAEAVLKGKMLTYQQQEEAKAEALRRQAEEAARIERQRLEAQALERQREAQAQAAAAAAAQAAGDMQAAQLAAANAQRAQAEAQSAASVAQVLTAPVLPVVSAAPKVAGVSTSTRIDFDVTSLRLLVAYIVTGKVYTEGDPAVDHPELLGLIKVDEVRLRAYVKGLGKACNLPGVRVFEQRGMSARAA